MVCREGCVCVYVCVPSHIEPVLPHVFRDNGQLYNTTQLGYILQYYRLVGPVKLRQVRVTNTSCNERRFLGLVAPHDGVESEYHFMSLRL